MFGHLKSEDIFMGNHGHSGIQLTFFWGGGVVFCFRFLFLMNSQIKTNKHKMGLNLFDLIVSLEL